MIRAGLVTVALLAAPPAAQAAGPDNPPQLTPSRIAASLGSVGRVRGADRDAGGCSAVLIAVDLALTAGHCGGGPTEGARRLQLIFGPETTPPRWRADVAQVHFHAESDGVRITIPTAYRDLALLRLAEPVPAHIATPLPLAQGPQAETVAIYGFVNPHNTPLHGHPLCTLDTIAPAVLGSDCTVISGFSGTPALSGGPGDWRVEGIAVARWEQPGLRAIIADVVPWPVFEPPVEAPKPD